MIQVVRADGLMLIGELQANKMVNPRLIVMRPDGQLYLQQLIGNPGELYLDALPAVRYEPGEGLIMGYREAVSGLVMATPKNVIDIAGAQK